MEEGQYFLFPSRKCERFAHALYHMGWPGYTQEYSSTPQDCRPGTRNFYLMARTDSPKSLFIHSASDMDMPILRLTPRHCNCAKLNKTDACKCCEDFCERDQPSIQGSVVSIFRTGLNLKKEFPGFASFTFEGSPTTHYVDIPSPELLFQFLKTMEIDAHFQLMRDGKSTSVVDFLHLLSYETFPIGNISDQSLRTYAHDLFNHLLTWAFMPAFYRHIACKRIAIAFRLLEEVKKAFSSSSSYSTFVDALCCRIAMVADANHGSMNGALTNNVMPVLAKDTHFRERLRTNAEAFLNLGVLCIFKGEETNPDSIYTIEGTRTLLSHWVKLEANQIVKSIGELYQTVPFYSSNRKYINFPHLARLSVLDAEELAGITAKVCGTFVEHLNGDVCKQEIQELDEFITAHTTLKVPLIDIVALKVLSLDEFYLTFCENYVRAIEKFESFSAAALTKQAGSFTLQSGKTDSCDCPDQIQVAKQCA